jgi:hypothetical protein
MRESKKKLLTASDESVLSIELSAAIRHFSGTSLYINPRTASLSVIEPLTAISREG